MLSVFYVILLISPSNFITVFAVTAVLCIFAFFMSNVAIAAIHSIAQTTPNVVVG